MKRVLVIKFFILVYLSLQLVYSKYSFAAESVLIDGDIKITGAGNIVFPDGSVQSKAILQGPIGPVGAQGVKGDTGATGLTGPQGPAGTASQYAKVIVVAQTGGDYNNLSSALSSITDASPSNHYLVKVMPGVYSTSGGMGNGHFIKSYVDIEGSGEKSTIFTASSPVFGTFYFDTVQNVEVRALTIKADQVGNLNYPAGIYIDNTHDVTFSNVTFELISDSTVDAIVTSSLSTAAGSNYTLKNVTINTPDKAIHNTSSATTGLILNSTINGSIASQGTMKIVNSLLKVIPSGSQAKTVNCIDANYDVIPNGWH